MFSLCLIKHHAMKTHKEMKYRSTILNLGFTPQPLYPRNNPPVPIASDDKWALRPLWKVRKTEKSLGPAEEENRFPISKLRNP
jgi:hypothetical protein